MRTTIWIGIVAVVLIGCSTPKHIGWDKYNLCQVVDVDSCEYMCGWIGGKHGGPIMTHKGNCKYCAQRQQYITKVK
jgi:hypothetical protein